MKIKGKFDVNRFLRMSGFMMLAFACIPIQAQSPHVHFDVASIRPSAPDKGPRDARAEFHGDRFDAEAYTVGDILDMLNGYQLHKVTGGPMWMRTDRYDIHAKADAVIPDEARTEAVMALLGERFHLVAHHETRDVPTVVLLAPKNLRG